MEDDKIIWTQEKIDLLKMYYPNSEWEDLFKILEYDNKYSIMNKAYSLKIKRNKYFYSNEDEEIIRKNYNIIPLKEIAKLINKSYAAIQTKIQRMNLQGREYWSEDEDTLFKKVYPKYSNPVLIKKYFPNRTSSSLQNHARLLNLSKVIGGSRRYDKDFLIIQLQELALKLNRTPLYSELSLYGLPSEATYRRYFGSYINACEIANLEINRSLFGDIVQIYRSLNNDICFSKSELIITDFFINNKINYIKEPYYKDYISDERCKTKRCDWIIKNNIFVEYFGLPEKDYYYEKMQVKRNICKDNNIKLIELFEKDLNSLNTIFNTYIIT